MRKWIVLGAAAALLAVVAAGGVFVWIRKHESRNIRGSSTVEFVPTERPTPKPTDPELASVPWPTYGHDPERSRVAAGVALRPPYRAIWSFRAHTLVEFPPAVA